MKRPEANRFVFTYEEKQLLDNGHFHLFHLQKASRPIFYDDSEDKEDEEPEETEPEIKVCVCRLQLYF